MTIDVVPPTVMVRTPHVCTNSERSIVLSNYLARAAEQQGLAGCGDQFLFHPIIKLIDIQHCGCLYLGLQNQYPFSRPTNFIGTHLICTSTLQLARRCYRRNRFGSFTAHAQVQVMMFLRASQCVTNVARSPRLSPPPPTGESKSWEWPTSASNHALLSMKYRIEKVQEKILHR